MCEYSVVFVYFCVKDLQDLVFPAGTKKYRNKNH